MSEELKTLKEIREQVYSQCKDEAEKRLLEHLFSSEDEEAVKWVKEYIYEMRRPNLDKKSITNLNGRIQGLMVFHNISNKDLE